jgi:hypothetical protein
LIDVDRNLAAPGTLLFRRHAFPTPRRKVPLNRSWLDWNLIGALS